MSASSDLQLLVTALQTNGEAESDGVKFIYMDDSTVYRFENNRMKKVSQAMLKKANKLLAQQNSIAPTSTSTSAPTSAPKRQRKSKQQQPPQPVQDVDDEEEEAEDEAPAPPPPPPAPKRQRKPKQQQPAPAAAMSSNIDLNEYWQVKNRNEYMNSEIERLNHKVSKLKQYKNIVTRLTGGEYDVDVPQQLQPQQQQQQQQPQYQQRAINDSLFMF